MSHGAPERIALLRDLYANQLAERPGDPYLQAHSTDHFLAGTERVFRFVDRWVPPDARVLDWGCHHAPDSCLLRFEREDAIELHGCDVVAPGTFGAFHEYARLDYRHLQHPYALPYDDECFDVVIASGVLEHVPLMYESLRELYRIVRLGGRLIITYLPNQLSIEEWHLRRNGSPEHHNRLLSRSRARGTLLRWGFEPLVLGYQTTLDLLDSDGESGVRSKLAMVGAHHFTSCLCGVATKVAAI